MSQQPPDDRRPVWEGGTYFPPPSNSNQPSQGQTSFWGDMQPPPQWQRPQITNQPFNPQFPSGQYPPQQAQFPQQQLSYPQQWGSMQPPEGTLQPAPIQQSYPVQYPPQQWQQQPLQGYAGQTMYPPAQPQIMMPQQVLNVNIQQHQHGLFTRALYFIFIGWWAGLIWLNIGYFFVMTIIGLPIGLMMLNRLPIVLTLKPASQSINISMTGNTTNININGTHQVNFLIRTLYFIFIGCWAGLLWSYVAYAMFVFILPIPIGVIMFNMLPTIITLRKN